MILNKEFVKLSAEQEERSILAENINHVWILDKQDQNRYVFAPIAILAFEKEHYRRLTSSVIEQGFGEGAIMSTPICVNGWKQHRGIMFFLRYQD